MDHTEDQSGQIAHFEREERDRLRELLKQIKAWSVEALALLADDHDVPQLTAKDRTKVAKMGESAHEHLLLEETQKRITLGDSREIRRRLYGSRVQGTATHFGPGPETGHILYRKVDDHESPPHDDQEVGITAEGRRIALLWRRLHGA